MQTRHKIPTVFNIYMVDVLCCALGCVVLLWQLSLQEAEAESAEKTNYIQWLEDATKQNNKYLKELEIAYADKDAALREKDATLKKLQAAQIAIASLSSEVGSLKVSLDASNKKNVQVTLQLDDTRDKLEKAVQLALVRKKEYDDLKKTHVAAEAMIALLKLDVSKAETKTASTADELAKKIRAHAELFDKLAEAEKRLRVLTKDLASKEADSVAATKRVEEKSNLLKLLEQELSLVRQQSKDTMTRLSTSDIRAGLLEKDLDRYKKELSTVNRHLVNMLKDQDTLSQRMMISVKELDAAKLAIAGLERDKLSFARKVAAAENRFAGIALTGRKVLFLVDMSGSMEMVDDQTFDPDKWPLVCEAVARIMRSLPDLTDYQVILFSDRVIYPFGKDGRWLKVEGENTPKKVGDGIKAVKPKGGTDMYAAFQEAFKFRDQGLDTIYVFSDGLPNIGEGLPANATTLTENQRTEALSKHVRSRLKNVWNRPIPAQPRVRINTVGFFFESPDVGAFLWALAREHEGSFVGMSKP